MARTATVAPAAPGEPEAGSAGGPEETSRAARLAAPLWPAALAAGTVWLGFDASGYFADTTGWGAAAVAVALAVSALALGRPPLGPTGATALAGGALAALAVWTLASGLWSDSMARALVEFDRVLLYLLVLLLFGAAPAPGVTLKRLPPAFLLAAVVLCGAGLVVRLLPDAWPFALPPANARMDYPLTYENALGAFAAVAIVFALHLASSAAERAPARVLAAGALPLLVATLVLTFSRGGIAAAVVGALAYVLIAPSRGLLGTLLAAGAPVAVAAAGAHGAELLASDRPRSAAAMAQGEELAALLAVAVLAAAALRALLLVPERRLPPLRPSCRALGAATAALVAAAAVALGVAAAGALGAVCAAGIAALCIVLDDPVMGAFALALTGACLGFLRYNLPARGDARIFLGDGGSMPLGFLLAALAINVPRDGDMGWPLLLGSSLLLALVVLDTLLVVVSRTRRGVSVATGGRDHLTHRLLARLGSPRAVALALVAAQVAASALAIFTLTYGRTAMIAAATGCLALGALIVAVLEHPGWAVGHGGKQAEPVKAPNYPPEGSPERVSLRD